MNENIKAGGDIHAGDGGYSIGTKEKYDEFVKNRNRMNERIKLLAEQAGYTKDMFGVGHWDMPECKKFAELIVRECSSIVSDAVVHREPASTYVDKIKKHFGVEE